VFKLLDNLDLIWAMNDELSHACWQNCPLLGWLFVKTGLCEIQPMVDIISFLYKHPESAPEGLLVNKSFMLPRTGDRQKISRALLQTALPIECISDPQLIASWPFATQLQDFEPMLETKKLLNLPGGKLAKERNGIKRWSTKWITTIAEYDIDKAIVMYDQWVSDMKGKVEANSIVFQRYLLSNLPQISTIYPITLACLERDGEYLSVSIGAKVSISTWTSLVRISRRGKDFQYASDAAFVQIARQSTQQFEADGWMGYYDEEIFGGLIRYKKKFLSIGRAKPLYALSSTPLKKNSVLINPAVEKSGIWEIENG